jgi:acetoacetyl-CoA synthetase
MWHWLVSGLASGATIVLFQGSPFKPHGALTIPKLLDRLQITHFGTSAAYLATLEQHNCRPLESGVDLSKLKAIYSTGSPLAPSTFAYVYDAFPKRINLGSITGGTDIISLFGAPSPLSPVFQGEIQVKGLGMDICAYTPAGTPTLNGEPGDLLCTQPFPSQPVGFWAVDGDNPSDIETKTSYNGEEVRYNQAKYRASYFEKFPAVWHHGDFVSFNPRTGGMIMLGRSDGVLNPSGVRFGSSEIYNIILAHFPAQVEDALCIGRQRVGDVDETVVLFLKMKKESLALAVTETESTTVVCDEAFKERVRAIVRTTLSPRHVPGIIDECFDIPRTTNDKK